MTINSIRTALMLAGCTTVISAVGLLTTPATAEASVCASYEFNGTYVFTQNNGFTVEVPWFGKSPSGEARAYGSDGGLALIGTASGEGIGSDNAHLSFTINWGASKGNYVGNITPDGLVSRGKTGDGRSQAGWFASQPFTCVA